jgi:hypothetical protein
MSDVGELKLQLELATAQIDGLKEVMRVDNARLAQEVDYWRRRALDSEHESNEAKEAEKEDGKEKLEKNETNDSDDVVNLVAAENNNEDDDKSRTIALLNDDRRYLTEELEELTDRAASLQKENDDLIELVFRLSATIDQMSENAPAPIVASAESSESIGVRRPPRSKSPQLPESSVVRKKREVEVLRLLRLDESERCIASFGGHRIDPGASTLGRIMVFDAHLAFVPSSYWPLRSSDPSAAIALPIASIMRINKVRGGFRGRGVQVVVDGEIQREFRLRKRKALIAAIVEQAQRLEHNIDLLRDNFADSNHGALLVDEFEDL